MIKPMLAHNFTPKKVAGHAQLALQGKLDGIRCLWDGHSLWSRTGKPIVSVPGIVDVLQSNFSGVPLDGELYSHGLSFQEIISPTRRTKNLNDDPRILYHVYDYPVANIEFKKRWEILLDTFSTHIFDRVKLVETRIVPATTDPLDIFTSLGYEGTMVRTLTGYYRFGKRSNDLLKIKSFHDAEFEIIDMEELCSYEKIIVPEGTPGSKRYADGTWYKDGTATPQNTLGAFVLRTKDGKVFQSGSGLDNAQRALYWREKPIGKLATIKYQCFSDTGVPRFPIFKCIRSEYE